MTRCLSRNSPPDAITSRTRLIKPITKKAATRPCKSASWGAMLVSAPQLASLWQLIQTFPPTPQSFWMVSGSQFREKHIFCGSVSVSHTTKVIRRHPTAAWRKTLKMAGTQMGVSITMKHIPKFEIRSHIGQRAVCLSFQDDSISFQRLDWSTPWQVIPEALQDPK